MASRASSLAARELHQGAAIVGAEYQTLKANLLLRVSGKLKLQKPRRIRQRSTTDPCTTGHARRMAEPAAVDVLGVIGGRGALAHGSEPGDGDTERLC